MWIAHLLVLEKMRIDTELATMPRLRRNISSSVSLYAFSFSVFVVLVGAAVCPRHPTAPAAFLPHFSEVRVNNHFNDRHKSQLHLSGLFGEQAWTDRKNKRTKDSSSGVVRIAFALCSYSTLFVTNLLFQDTLCRLTTSVFYILR